MWWSIPKPLLPLVRQVVSPARAARAVARLEDMGLATKLNPKLAPKQQSELLERIRVLSARNWQRQQLRLNEEARRREEGSEMQTAEELRRQHADPNAMDRLGDTALSYAANKGDLQLVQHLLDAGAQLEARDELGFTALMIAAQGGHLKVVEALLTAGAQLEARDNQGTTALRMAAERGQLQVIAALEARDELGFTAPHGCLESRPASGRGIVTTAN